MSFEGSLIFHKYFKVLYCHIDIFYYIKGSEHYCRRVKTVSSPRAFVSCGADYVLLFYSIFSSPGPVEIPLQSLQGKRDCSETSYPTSTLSVYRDYIEKHGLNVNPNNTAAAFECRMCLDQNITCFLFLMFFRVCS